MIKFIHNSMDGFKNDSICRATKNESKINATFTKGGETAQDWLHDHSSVSGLEHISVQSQNRSPSMVMTNGVWAEVSLSSDQLVCAATRSSKIGSYNVHIP